MTYARSLYTNYVTLSDDHNFSHYIFSNLNKVTMVLAIFSFVGVDTLINSWKLRIAVIGFLWLLLIITSIHTFKDKRKVFKEYTH